MVTSYKYTKLVQSCIDPNKQRCSHSAKKIITFDFIFFIFTLYYCTTKYYKMNISSSGVTGGGKGATVPPDIFQREIFADSPGKRGKEKRESGEKRRKIAEGKE